MSSSALAAHAEQIARGCSASRKALTSATLRFGAHGCLASRSAAKKAGVWYDHETETGGGMLTSSCASAAAIVPMPSSGSGPSGSLMRDNGAAGAPRRRIAEYIYHDRDGEPLYRVVRWSPKSFSQERWDPAAGKFVGGRGCMENVQRMPYRLAEWASRGR